MDGTWSELRTRTRRPFIVNTAVLQPAMLDQDSSPRREY